MRNQLEEFLKWHTTWANLICHFATAIFQIAYILFFFKTWSCWWLLALVITPWITDGLGHVLEGNLYAVAEQSKRNKTTNAANVNWFDSFMCKLLALPYAMYKDYKKKNLPPKG